MERRSPEQQPEPETEGEKYLRLLDLQDLADLPIPGHDEYTVKDFLNMPGEAARALPVLKGFESLDPGDSRYISAKNMLRSTIAKYVGVKLEN